MATQYHEIYEFTEGDLMCSKCRIPLVKGEVILQYMGNDFPVLLPKCPLCGLAYVPKELAEGKIFEVEQALEDK